MYFEACFYGENLRKQPLRNLHKSPESFSQIIFSKTLPKGDAMIVNFRTLSMKLSPRYKYSISCCFFYFLFFLCILLGHTVQNEASLFTLKKSFPQKEVKINYTSPCSISSILKNIECESKRKKVVLAHLSVYLVLNGILFIHLKFCCYYIRIRVPTTDL